MCFGNVLHKNCFGTSQKRMLKKTTETAKILNEISVFTSKPIRNVLYLHIGLCATVNKLSNNKNNIKNQQVSLRVWGSGAASNLNRRTKHTHTHTDFSRANDGANVLNGCATRQTSYGKCAMGKSTAHGKSTVSAYSGALHRQAAHTRSKACARFVPFRVRKELQKWQVV